MMMCSGGGDVVSKGPNLPFWYTIGLLRLTQNCSFELCMYYRRHYFVQSRNAANLLSNANLGASELLEL